MKKSKTFKMLALVIATVAFAACGTKTTTTTTTDDTTADTGLPGDTTATGDTTSVNLCVHATPATDPGCTSTADKAAVAALKADTTKADKFAGVVADCTLKKGCLAKGDECGSDDAKAVEQGLCIASCIVDDSAQLVSANCAWCYGEFSGVCGFRYCLNECAAAPSSKGCGDCLAAHCDPVADACKAGK
jgi:hypothetical protein